MYVSRKLAMESELLRREEGKAVATHMPKTGSTAQTPLPDTALDTSTCHNQKNRWVGGWMGDGGYSPVLPAQSLPSRSPACASQARPCPEPTQPQNKP